MLIGVGAGYLLAQPMKIAGAITVSTLFMIKLAPTGEMWANAFWVTTVIVLVRNETAASSFFQAFQRVEGTVIGAIYAFSMYHFLSCSQATELNDTGTCSWRNISLSIILWIGFCASFRDSTSHFYAAQVAGITPIMLFMGPTKANVIGAWNRVMMTLTGVTLYLIIENLIFPVRISDTVRAGILGCLNKTAVVCEQLATGVGVVIETVSSTTETESVERYDDNLDVDSEINDSSSTGEMEGVLDTINDGINKKELADGSNAEQAASFSVAQSGKHGYTVVDTMDSRVEGISKYVASTEETLKTATEVSATIRRLMETMKLAPFEPELWYR
jgi:hypothetical protein